MKELEFGDVINVGDIVIVSTCLGYKQFNVTRVTKTLAISKSKSGAENKFKRVFDYNISHPYSESTNSYLVLRAEK